MGSASCGRVMVGAFFAFRGYRPHMSRTPDQTRLRYASIDGAATAIDDLRKLEPALADESREHWPDLWVKIDRLLAILHEA